MSFRLGARAPPPPAPDTQLKLIFWGVLLGKVVKKCEKITPLFLGLHTDRSFN